MSVTVDQLKTLPKLPKLHLGWYFAPPFPPLDLLTEFARITGSVPLSLEWSLPEDIRAALVVAQATGCGIGITSQPYQRMSQAKLPASNWGDVFQSDLTNFRDRLKAFVSVKDLVTHVFYDVEHWHTHTENVASLTGKYQALMDLADAAFPNAKAIGYDHGAMQPNGGDPSGWRATDYYPHTLALGESCSMYFAEHEVNREVFIRSGGLDSQTVPVLGLGGCYRRAGSSWGKYAAPGQGVDNLWLLGLELNNPHPSVAGNPERFPLSKAPLVYLYHGCPTEVWLAEFVTYCQGAANQAIKMVARVDTSILDLVTAHGPLLVDTAFPQNH